MFKQILFFSFLLILSSCSDDPNTPEPINFSKVELQFRSIIPGEQLPPLTTNFAINNEEDKLIAIGQSGTVSGFSFQDSSWSLLGSFEIDEVVPGNGDLGLVGIALDPDFSSNGYFYLSYSTSDNMWDKLVVYQWSDQFADIKTSSKEILSVERYNSTGPWHGMTSIEFNHKGELYITLGEAGNHDLAQTPDRLNGSLLKIVPIPSEGTYEEITTPHLAHVSEAISPEIQAMGLRSPFRMSVYQDYVFIADVGQGEAEEINLFYPNGMWNFGWYLCEGPCPDTVEAAPNFEEPIDYYHRDGAYSLEDPEVTNTARSSIAVGSYIDFDSEITEEDIASNPTLLMDKHLIYWDILIGFIRLIPMDLSTPNEPLVEESFHLGHRNMLTSVKQHPISKKIYATQLAGPAFEMDQRGLFEVTLEIKEVE